VPPITAVSGIRASCWGSRSTTASVRHAEVSDELTLRTATAEDFTELAGLISAAFLQDVEDETLDLHRLVNEPERSHVVTDRGRIVGTGAVLTRDLTVPGADVPAAHVTAVAVASTHRRRGLLTRIMTAQLEAVRDNRVEPIAVLWASEGAIYGRFGYGLACWQVHYEIPTRETTVVAGSPAGSLRQASPPDVIDELAGVYDRARLLRPGRSGRDERWWKYLTADPKPWRRGLSAQRVALYETAESVDGYAIWRVKPGWSHTGPDGKVEVSELVAATGEAHAWLWQFLLSIDLTRTVTFSFAAVDDSLPHQVSNPSALETHVSPGLWIRVVDLPGALTARRYAAPVDVVLEVSDALLPDNAGRWRLVADPSSANYERTETEPDLVLDVRSLGAAYLGGVTLHSLAAAGLVTENKPGSLAAVSTAFGWHVAPASWEIF
jgi:predicted acetyltransferase